MNIMWYTGKFDEASWNFLQHIGISPVYLREQMRGMVAVEQTTQLKRELLAGDTISVRSQGTGGPRAGQLTGIDAALQPADRKPR